MKKQKPKLSRKVKRIKKILKQHGNENWGVIVEPSKDKHWIKHI